MIIKLIPLFAPIIIYFLIQLTKSYFRSYFKGDDGDRSEKMLSCLACGTFVHESLVLNKFGKNFCSEKCANS